MFVSLFWLIPITMAHLTLEIVTSKSGTFKEKFYHGLSHIKLDIVLIIFALWLTIYFEAIFGAVGLSATTRAVAQGGTRFFIWQETIRGILMSLDDMTRLAKGVIRVRNRNKNNNVEKEEIVEEQHGFSKGDYFIIALGLIFSTTLIFAPYIIDIDYANLLSALKEQLRPY